MHLAFVVSIADTEEVVIQDLIQIVLLHALELLQRLLELLFTLIVGKQSAFLTLEDFLKEPSFASEHLANFEPYFAPV